MVERSPVAGGPTAGSANARGDGRAERGSATAELAAALPAVVLLLVLGVNGVGAAIARLRCFDAAREAALAQARGAPGEPAGRRAAPTGATVTLWADGDLVRVVVRTELHPFGRRLPGLVVEGTAVAAREPVR
jgi:hypothetical protein